MDLQKLFPYRIVLDDGWRDAPKYGIGDKVIYRNGRLDVLEIDKRRLDVRVEDGALHMGWRYDGWLLGIEDKGTHYQRTRWSRGIVGVRQGDITSALDKEVLPFKP